jgi:serine/threonine protein kinase
MRVTQLGSYEILEELGSGGMASVYRAYHPAMDRFVAIKLIKDNLAFDKASLERFKDEARLIARLEHPHLLPIYDYAADSHSAYIVMRYLEGTSLRAILDKSGALPFHEIVHLCRQIASVLDYAHSQGVIHRDIKAENILLDTVGNAYLTDFGIAGFIGDRKSSLAGTPATMSPEQIRGNERLSPSSDIYSLGVVLFEMATGRLPFEAPTEDEVMKQHLHAPIPSAKKLNPYLPDRIDIFFQKALAKNPSERMSSAADMRRALESMLAPNEAFRSLMMVKEVAQAEVQDMRENRSKSQNGHAKHDLETSRGIKETLVRANSTIQSVEQATVFRSKRSPHLYYLILLLFFIISVLLLIGLMGLPKSANVRMTEIAQTRSVLGIAQAQTATVNASNGIFSSPVATMTEPVIIPSATNEIVVIPSATSEVVVIPSATAEAILSPSPEAIASPTTAIVVPPTTSNSLEQVGLAYLNLPEPEAVLVFPQMALYSVDRAFDVELNPLGSSTDPSHLYAAPNSSLVVTAVDERGMHLDAAQNSFFVADSGDYTSGIEFSFQNLPEIFVSIEAGQTCVGIYSLSDNVLYFDCLVGACSYHIGVGGDKRPVPAGQRLVAGFENQATERIIPIPESAILQYESFLNQSPNPATYLDCIESYLVSTPPNNPIVVSNP